MNIRTILVAGSIAAAMTFATKAAAMSADTTASKTVDTSFVFNKQKYEISQNGERTSVKVYKKNGKELEKTLETQFLDGQEVEQVYITSPFIPRKAYNKRNQQYSHYPMFYFGGCFLASSAFGVLSSDKNIKDARSAEWGITGLTFEFPLNSTLAITTAMSASYTCHQFNKNYVLSTTEGVTSLQPFTSENGDEHPKKSYLSYFSARIPIMLEWSKQIGGSDAYAAIGPSIEFRSLDRSRYKLGKKTHTLSKENNINTVGLNLEARVGYSLIMLYARTSLTPLLKTKFAPEWHPFSIGLGFRF